MSTCRPYREVKQAEGSERGYLGRSRSKTGRKLVRVRAAATGEIVWQTVISARRVESLPVLQEAIQAAEALLGMAGDSDEAQRKRARTEIRLDSSWGSEAILTWLLSRGYQVTGKFKSTSRVRPPRARHHDLVGDRESWAGGGRGACPGRVRPSALAICGAHPL